MRPGFWQILIVIALAVVLFGAKKIPELARSIGKAKGEFKKGTEEGEALLKDEDKKKVEEKKAEDKA